MRMREKLIHIRMTEEEHEIISEQAGKLNMQIAPYMRRVAINPNIVIPDYNIISAHTKEIAEIRNSINRLIFTIEATNNYLPKEIKEIVTLMNEIFKIQNQLLRTIRESY